VVLNLVTSSQTERKTYEDGKQAYVLSREHRPTNMAFPSIFALLELSEWAQVTSLLKSANKQIHLMYYLSSPF